MRQPEITSRGPVGQVDLGVSRPAPRRVPLREIRAKTVARVLEEYRKSGFIPPSLHKQLIDDESALRWAEGRPMPREAVERHVNEWAVSLLERKDRQHSRRRKDVS